MTQLLTPEAALLGAAALLAAVILVLVRSPAVGLAAALEPAPRAVAAL